MVNLNRELTAHEISICPEWATHYIVCDCTNDIIFESVDFYWWEGMEAPVTNSDLHSRAILINNSTDRKKPIIIHGMEDSFELEVCDIKRPTVYGAILTFECPYCGVEAGYRQDLSDGDPLEYGSFHTASECDECGKEFEEQQWEVTATLSIKVKENK